MPRQVKLKQEGPKASSDTTEKLFAFYCRSMHQADTRNVLDFDRSSGCMVFKVERNGNVREVGWHEEERETDASSREGIGSMLRANAGKRGDGVMCIPIEVDVLDIPKNIDLRKELYLLCELQNEVADGRNQGVWMPVGIVTSYSRGSYSHVVMFDKLVREEVEAAKSILKEADVYI